MKQRYIKLSEYARKNCLTYRGAYNHWQSGILKGKQLATGTILVEEDEEIIQPNSNIRIATYARVSSPENKNNLEKQSERLRNYASIRGYKIIKEVKEVGSGLNDERKKLYDILTDNSIDIILVEHKDRIARFGLNYISALLEKQNRKIEIINETSNGEEGLMEDFVSIITSFCARLYGKRRSKRKTEQIIKNLNDKDI